MIKKIQLYSLVFSSLLLTQNAVAETEAKPIEICTGYAGQTPRDIDSKTGTNSVIFELAPASTDMNLCNIHFHNNAEHKAADFSIYAGEGDHGHGGGYQCGISKSLTAAELVAPSGDICKGLVPGDTIEVHWVHTSCDVAPGPGLGSCLSYDGNQTNGFHQAKAIPSNTGLPVEFMGSTTGPSYTEQACSPLQVTWSVRPQCAKLNINTIGKWCEGNVFDEDHAHGVRKLVTDERLLAPIQ